VAMARLTIKEIRQKKGREKITVLTAYDHLFARLLDRENIDILLVGDSLGMVLLGYESTVPVTMREMLHHVKAVSRAAGHSLVVADMPFGSYDTPEKALRNAARFIKEGGAHAVKLEGGATIEKQVRALVRAGFAVMGHVGLTPQTASQMGGYRVQGRERQRAEEIMRDAVRLDRLGVFSMVLECIPAVLAGRITRRVRCPTIGIGAGPKTDGQVLVLYDMLGFETGVEPKFLRAYAAMGKMARKAVQRFRDDVLRGDYPSERESY